MRVKIYQINGERDKNSMMFMSTYHLSKLGFDKKINSEIYDKVFDGNVPARNLEDVYLEFNHDLSEDYVGRSLSVSDIIEVIGHDKVKDGFYFVDRFGFKPVEFDVSKTQVLQDKNAGNAKLTVLYIEPEKAPKEIEIDDTLESMQHLVDGYIEEFQPFEDDVSIVCNEEGKMLGKPLNRAVYDDKGNMIDVIAGSFFIVKSPYGSEKFESLPKPMIEKYKEKFKNPERFIKTSHSIKVVPIKPVKDKSER